MIERIDLSRDKVRRAEGVSSRREKMKKRRKVFNNIKRSAKEADYSPLQEGFVSFSTNTSL